MTTTIGSLDLNTLNDLYSDSNQYFWFESNSSATYGAGAHVTLVPDTTFISNPTGQNILMNTDGFSIRNGLLPMMTLDNDSLDFNVVDTTEDTYVTTASFSSTWAQIGQSDGSQSYMYLDFHSLRMIDKEGNPYLYVSDLRNDEGYYTMTEYHTGNSHTSSDPIRIFLKFLPIDKATTIVEVSFDDGAHYTQIADNDYSVSDNEVDVTLWTSTNFMFRITYRTEDSSLKAYTFGTRNSYNSNDVGIYSYAVGYGVESSGYLSYAEGIRTVASGDYSHAEGYSSTASGENSHAEGDGVVASGLNSHAEGGNTTSSGLHSHAQGFNTTSSGKYSHTEGLATRASGEHSHAQNRGTIAQGQSQTAIGAYNIANGSTSSRASTDHAFIIGNGTANNARSNALTVDWDGNVEASGGAVTKGHVQAQSSILDRASTTAPSSSVYGAGFYANDKNGDYIARFTSSQNSSNGMGALITGAKEVNGTVNTNSFFVYLDASGNPHYWVTNSANFRADLSIQGALATSSWAPSITRTSGGTLSSLTGRRYGKVVTLKFVLKYSTSVSAGSNAFVGTLTNSGYTPPFATFASTYYVGVPLVCQLESSGKITCRVTGSNAVTLSTGCTFSLTYIVD